MADKIIRLHAIGPWAGCDSIEDIEIPDGWGEWSKADKDKYITEEAENNFWNSGFECWGEVVER